jgi:Putative neutral zinc metallopeptidase
VTTPSLSRCHATRGTAAVLATFVATGGVLAGCGGNDDKSTSKTATTKQAAFQTQKLPTRPNAADATKTGGGKAALASLPATSRSAAQPRIKGVEGQPLGKQLAILDNDIADFWLGQFNKAKIKFQTVTTKTAPPGGAISTACGDLSGDNDISYCPKDSTINLLQSFFEKHAAPIGDFAVALPVAYLWGQAVEHQLGIDAKASDKQSTLIAQCLAGAWAASVYQRGALEPGDLQEGAKLIATIAPSQQANQDLVAAFNQGYNGGKSGSCGKVGA